MASTRQFKLPNEKFRLEEINFPEALVAALAGRALALSLWASSQKKNIVREWFHRTYNSDA
jgi:hypothetical protein